MSSANRCAILVPVANAIDPGCEDALRELERRGYVVWRVRGYAAIDAARNQMANDALAHGFDELMWIDADIVFDPDDVDKLRRHDLPLVCGIYPKKGCRQFACAFLPDTRHVLFGVRGGMTTGAGGVQPALSGAASYGTALVPESRQNRVADARAQNVAVDANADARIPASAITVPKACCPEKLLLRVLDPRTFSPACRECLWPRRL